MILLKTAIASGVMLAVISSPGLAQSNLNTACTRVPCVYDNHGQKVGIVSTAGASNQEPSLRSLLRLIGRQWYVMGYTDHGLQADAVFYYGDANCATTPYVASGIGWVNNNINAVEQLIPYPAMFDGTAIWGPTGPVVEIVIKSFQYPTRSSYCWVESSQGAPVVVRAAAIIEKPLFYPPFKVQ